MRWSIRDVVGRSLSPAHAHRLVTGWSIGQDGDGAERHAAALYEQLDSAVLPLYYAEPARWRWMMKQAIGNVAYYFNSQRMMRRCATEAYLRA